MGATIITTLQGRVIEAAMGYEDASAFLAPRKLTADDGWRELRRADGGMAKVNIGQLATIEQAAEKRDRTIGFR